ncbi:MAG: TetR/AcrR family transcriptional regulator [Actinomycetia bacterium]|nr:TetR/AcrR family transcriptional regulator [Actinomycetes bacterium]
MRADARSNRDRVLAAARDLFAERGIDVGMREIARRAEVGPATLYRRFPTKQDVIDEAFAVELRACRRAVFDGFDDPDAWHGFTSAVRRLIVLNVRNRGFVDAFTSAKPMEGPLAEHRRELLGTLGDLARRAQRSGRLRSDFVSDDLVLVLLAGRGLSAKRTQTRETAAHRFADLMIDALGTEPAR